MKTEEEIIKQKKLWEIIAKNNPADPDTPSLYDRIDELGWVLE